MLEDELVFLTSQKEAEVDEPTTDDFYHVGTICKVKQMIKLPGEYSSCISRRYFKR